MRAEMRVISDGKAGKAATQHSGAIRSVDVAFMTTRAATRSLLPRKPEAMMQESIFGAMTPSSSAVVTPARRTHTKAA